jgi:hypothetical protein
MECANYSARGEGRIAPSNGLHGSHQNEADVQLRISQGPKSANLWERLSESRIPYRYPVLYGSFLELRNCFHRIRSLQKQGNIRPAEIGSVYQQSPVPGYLERNKRSQGRSLGIQKLLSDSPWLTTEDFRLFLAGWDMAQEWDDRLGTQDSNVYRQA